jgi:hypothetical protein
LGGSNWGSGLGCELNQPQATTANPNPVAGSTVLAGSGISVALDNRPAGADAVYLIVDNGGTDYFCALTAASGKCTWAEFNTAPWSTTGIAMVGPPMASHVQVEVSSGAGAESWKFCVTALAIAP